jgi:hypothetical protein
VKLDVDIDALDAANKIDYEKRTIVNREVDRLKANIKPAEFPSDLPAEEINIGDVTAKMQEAAQHNNEITERQGRREREKVKVDGLKVMAKRFREEAERSKIRALDKYRELITSEKSAEKYCFARREELAAQIEGLQKQIQALNTEAQGHLEQARKYSELLETPEKMSVPHDAIESIQMAEQRESEAAASEKRLAEAPPLPDTIELSEFQDKIQSATRKNELIRQKRERDKLLAELMTAQKKSNDFTKAMEERTDQRQNAIASAKMPIPGLSFGDGEVLFNELPLNQASDAERLRISVAIAMSMNPKLRVLRIRDGSLLDESNLSLISQMAKDSDYQIWLEVLKSDSPARVEMRDGEVQQLSEGEASLFSEAL